MLHFNDSIEYEEEVVDDAFDEELGAFEKMFGALVEDINALEDLDEIKQLRSELNFIDALGEMNA